MVQQSMFRAKELDEMETCHCKVCRQLLEIVNSDILNDFDPAGEVEVWQEHVDECHTLGRERSERPYHSR